MATGHCILVPGFLRAAAEGSVAVIRILHPSERTGYGAVLVLAVLSRAAHLAGYFLSPVSRLYYWPVLAAARFETAAKALAAGSAGSGPFVYASPLYRFLILPFYAAGLERTGLFLLQSALGVCTALLLYRTARRIGVPAAASMAACFVWILYAPAVFFELTVLPVSMLTFLTLLFVWAGVTGRIDTLPGALLAGLAVAVVTGLRPPMLLLGTWPLVHWLRRRSYRLLLAGSAAFLLPILFLSWQQCRAGGGFTPFPRATGLNLVLGHAEGVTGYGPPVESEGLVETSTEDIHQVAARVAAERGFTTPGEADSYWLSRALSWALGHPADEARLIMVKLGGFLGGRAFDTYYDMGRLGRFSAAIRAHIVPRLLLVALFLAGLVGFLRKGSGFRWLMMLPVAVSAASSLIFVHCERFSLPVIPEMLLVGISGLTVAFGGPGKPRAKSIVPLLLGLLLLVPGFVWPVPTVPEGMYVYSLGIRAFCMGDYELSLELFSRAGVLCPEGSVLWVESHRQAAAIAEALGDRELAAGHRRIIEGY